MLVLVYLHSSHQRWNTEHRFMINEQPSLLDQDTQWTAPSHLSSFRIYQSMMRAQKNASSEEDMLQCLVIMARLHLVLFRTETSNTARKYRESQTVSFDEDEALYYDWGYFRQQLEIFQNSVRTFSQFTARHFSQLEFSKPLQDVRSDEEDAITEARALEAEIRDILQILSSRLAIKESRKSIEEGKRLKLRTFS